MRGSERGGRDPWWPNSRHTARRRAHERRGGPPPIAARGAGRCMYNVEYIQWRALDELVEFLRELTGRTPCMPRLTGFGPLPCRPLLRLVACCVCVCVCFCSACPSRALRVACMPCHCQPSFVVLSPSVSGVWLGVGGVDNPVQILEEERSHQIRSDRTHWPALRARPPSFVSGQEVRSPCPCVLAAGRISETSPSSGAHYVLRPVDEDVPTKAVLGASSKKDG